MSGLVYYNGVLLPEGEALLPISDKSYLYGEGLFETMKASGGFIPFLEAHLSRLFRGMDLLQLKSDITSAKLEFAVYQTLFHNQLKDAYIRITLSGVSDEAGVWENNGKTNLLVSVNPLPKLPAKLYQEGCSAIVMDQFKISPDPLHQIKSTSYLRNFLARKEALRQGAEEALLVNVHGRLAEGATTNIFLHDGSCWLTPPLREGALPGVTRQALLDLMQKNDIPFEERPLERGELLEAQEAFLTNAIKEIIPLTRVDGFPIQQGGVGEETLRLRQLFKEEIQLRFEKFESRRQGFKESG